MKIKDSWKKVHPLKVALYKQQTKKELSSIVTNSMFQYAYIFNKIFNKIY